MNYMMHESPFTGYLTKAPTDRIRIQARVPSIPLKKGNTAESPGSVSGEVDADVVPPADDFVKVTTRQASAWTPAPTLRFAFVAASTRPSPVLSCGLCLGNTVILLARGTIAGVDFWYFPPVLCRQRVQLPVAPALLATL